MEPQKENESFQYTYSAKQQAEIRQIRNKYMAPEEDKMEQLRRLDRRVTQKGNAVSIAVGVIGTLLLGIGMSCTMVGTGAMFIPGIIIGLIGILILVMAYPLYQRITRKEREKIAPEILRLTDELMK